jgi:hypothetical protein
MHKLLNNIKTAFIYSESGFTHNTFMILIFVVFSVFFAFKLVSNHVSADSPKITSGISGYCMNIESSKPISGSVVDNEKCNNTVAQVWTVDGVNITHESEYCLSVSGDNSSLGAKIVLNSCDNVPGQVWLRDQNGFFNPNSGMCLSSIKSSSYNQLQLDNCNLLSQQQIWYPSNSSDDNYGQNAMCKGSKGVVIACEAEKQWSIWQESASNHEALLNTYTDGAPYEEWCADFVSYIYKESGYPFTLGETNGWDENNANNIQNQGFTEHLASSGYIPKLGDVAYFNYSSGHVEIVVSGGKTPTFIYGNSATIDPSTGNGEMMSNTIINDGNAGQLIYYLSPN